MESINISEVNLIKSLQIIIKIGKLTDKPPLSSLQIS